MEPKIIVCGDIHGDWAALNRLISAKRPDIVLQVGDFGWWPNEKYMGTDSRGRGKSWSHEGVKSNGASVYFCDGNHEHHSSLVQDGEIHHLYDKVYHCSRGSCLTLPDGRKVLFAGGASSIDQQLRVQGIDWFPEELISYDELDLMMAHDTIDIVISHTCPSVISPDGPVGKYNDSCRFALNEVLHRYNPRLWFFGHWHQPFRQTWKYTVFECLDYPRHRGRWWVQLKNNKRF